MSTTDDSQQSDFDRSMLKFPPGTRIVLAAKELDSVYEYDRQGTIALCPLDYFFKEIMKDHPDDLHSYREALRSYQGAQGDGASCSWTDREAVRKMVTEYTERAKQGQQSTDFANHVIMSD